jgi:hypothetical protein
MTREDILNRARECVCGERQHDYGTPENSFKVIARFWTAYLAATHPELEICSDFISTKDVAMMMALLKIARAAKGDKADNYIDLAGYAACAGEMLPDDSDAMVFQKVDQCVCCGKVIPEGQQVCEDCRTYTDAL